ncbi:MULTISPECIES: iron-siderophore ABC transporter substrate-binding protein [Vibrio]|uniref:iron-siderophore ABC transporter substrate-binding protein n=1 Tax=Vibrio TaxID=662 RepID=UPI000BA969BB|nr:MULTISPECIES: iron-siderophore ABC transporter substrate-binding protein [Vibrio]PAR30152.1 peptide ABC transporter substrate-binding protein [Vibrio metoecus]PAR36749.1 peptide ABC transporter substrate-binding protein [Vibrio metoecus]PAR44540.1 peptide ABC transporter substrate-binding protein [Vibrio metoecus]PAR62965.1 peptide ABC transporter substrate-binding protein [Vibrio metoecus]RBM55072.1 iron-siderophore ABC transporter substrate-binding protein [Vibrio tarriae]
MKTFITLLVSMLAVHAYALDIQHEMGNASFAAPPKKVVALDWTLAETVLSLGVELQGVADAKGYQEWVVEPALNPTVTNVGSRREPNIELLSELKPDVILMSQQMAAAYESLNKIAPVVVLTLYNEQKQPLKAAESITRSLGQLFGKEQQAEQVITQTQAKLTTNGEKIRAKSPTAKSLLFVRFINDKTLRIHGQGSLASATISAMGLKNSWQDQTNIWGFTTTGLEKLAEHQQSNVMLFGPLKPQDRQVLQTSPLWQVMAFTRENAVYELPPIWTFGGLIASQRFSDHIAELLVTQ